MSRGLCHLLLVLGTAVSGTAFGGPERCDTAKRLAALEFEKRVDAERRADLEAYKSVRESLAATAAGKWVVIAGGRVSATGSTFDEVATASPEALHRYVVEVGKDGPKDGPYECFVGAWHGPHFAGPGLSAALGVRFQNTPDGATISLKDGRTIGPYGTPPHPRCPLSVASPIRSAKPVERRLEAYVEPDALSPDVVLTAEDWASLGLSRFEIPEDMPLFGGVLAAGTNLTMRKAHARVTIPGEPSISALVVAACPAFSEEGLVAVSRAYNRFWKGYTEPQSEAVTRGRSGKWIVYALDRVVGEGATIEDAIGAADRLTVPTYHRFVLRVPRGEPLRLRRDDFGDERRAAFSNVKDVPVREMRSTWDDSRRILLIRPEDAVRLCLQQYEDGRDVFLVDGAKETQALGAYAAETPGAGSAGSAPVLRLLVWEAPRPLFERR